MCPLYGPKSEPSFQELRKWMMTTQILTLPTGSGCFVIFTDASNVDLGYILMQDGKVVTYSSRQLKEHEWNPVTND